MKMFLILVILITSMLCGDSRYKVNGEVVTDKLSSLMWQRSDDGQKKSWSEAKDYCASLKLLGHKDWRLPSIDELVSIVDKKKFAPAIDRKAFECKNAYYWSATEATDKGAKLTDARGVMFKNGNHMRYFKDYKDYVRCVRSSD